MLEAARGVAQRQRIEVVVGTVETHGRYDTAALLLGLELLPRAAVKGVGTVCGDLDLDAILARSPQLLLIDELARVNPPGSRHAKRWQDVDEILDLGIDVYATLNVQRLESLRDVVARITGVRLEETVPDAFVDRAHELRLIDVPPDEILAQLKEAPLSLASDDALPVETFLSRGNLLAFRELALRQMAQRADAETRLWNAAHGLIDTFTTAERILVAVSSSPASLQLVRAACRMASSLHATWIAVHVETPATRRLSRPARERLAYNLGVADQLGAEIATTAGTSAAEEILRYAQRRRVSKIVVGKPTHSRLWDLVQPSFLERIVRASGQADVYVICREDGGETPAEGRTWSVPARVSAATGYMSSLLAIVLATAVSWALFGQRELADAVMMLLLGIVFVAMRFGYGPSLLAVLCGVLSLDYFFIPPYYTLRVGEMRHGLTFAIMLMVALIVSSLTQRLRAQREGSRERERRTASLYAMSRELAAAASVDAMVELAVRHLAEVFDAKVALFVPGEDGALASSARGELALVPDDKESAVAAWVWAHQRRAGLSTGTLPHARGFHLPLLAGSSLVGVLATAPSDPQRFREPDQRELLDTFAGQIATAIERAKLADTAQKTRVQIGTEQLRNSLLSSVSHDLRTPLAVITGSATTLADSQLDEETRRELLRSIQEESHRLNRLVGNLLDMTRLQAGAMRVKKEWQALEEVVGSALDRLEPRLQGRALQTHLGEDLTMAPFDAVLIEQVFLNLVENALKYTPLGSPIDIGARQRGSWLEVDVADRGPGIAVEDRERVFDKFYRAHEGKGGVGLGLTICRGIVVAHGGRLWVESRPGGGAVLRFTLPLEGAPPQAPRDDPAPPALDGAARP